MSTRSAEESAGDQQAESANSSSQVSKPGGAHGGEGGEVEVEIEVEVKAPVHDASSAGHHKAPAATQAQTKADLAKVAQTLKQDAAEGEISPAAPFSTHAVRNIHTACAPTHNAFPRNVPRPAFSMHWYIPSCVHSSSSTYSVKYVCPPAVQIFVQQ